MARKLEMGDVASCMCDDGIPYLHCHARLASELHSKLAEAAEQTSFEEGMCIYICVALPHACLAPALMLARLAVRHGSTL